MAFANARNTTVYDSHFTDVQGDHNIYNVTGQITVSRSESGLLALLKVICPGASFDSQERYPPPRCHPGTRVEILDQIFGWFEAGPGTRCREVLWVHGPAGAGKSAIAQTVCERAAERGDLAASFFFSRGKRDESAQLFTTIAFQLSMSISGHRVKVQDAIEADPLVIHRSTHTQIQKLIVEPLSEAVPDSDTAFVDHSRQPLLIVIDGLDECKGNDAQARILAQILDLVQTHLVPLRFMVVSRPEPHIYHSFHKTGLLQLTTEISFYGDRQSREDVRTYLLAEFERMYCSERHSIIFSNIPRPFPSTGDLELLVDRSEGYFIYASTIIQFLDEEFFSPVDRLAAVLSTSSTRPSPFAELDALYHQVLSTNPNTALLSQILSILVWHPNPTIGYICYFLDLSPEHVLLNLRGLHSVVSIESLFDAEPWSHHLVFPTHKSLCDFLLDASRAGKHYIDFQKVDRHLSLRCIDVLESWIRVPFTSESQLTRQLIIMHLVTLVHEASTHVRSMIEKLGAIDTTTWLLLMRHHLNLSVHESAQDNYDQGYWSIIDIFDHAIHLIQDLDCDLTQRMIDLRDMAYRVYISWKSPDELLIFQSICALYGDLRDLNILELLGLQNAPHDVRLMSRAIVDLLDKLPSAILFQKFGPPVNPSAYHDFRHYMSNRRRCGDLYLDPTLVHAHLAYRCLSVLTELPWYELGRDSIRKGLHQQTTATGYQYARLYWALHLYRAERTNHAQLTHLLQHIPRLYLLDVEYFSGAVHDAQRFEERMTEPIGAKPYFTGQKDSRPKSVWILNSFYPHVNKASDFLPELRKDDHAKARLFLHWLEAIDDPPPDLLGSWRACYREISLEMGCECNEDDAVNRLDRRVTYFKSSARYYRVDKSNYTRRADDPGTSSGWVLPDDDSPKLSSEKWNGVVPVTPSIDETIPALANPRAKRERGPNDEDEEGGGKKRRAF